MRVSAVMRQYEIFKHPTENLKPTQETPCKDVQVDSPEFLQVPLGFTGCSEIETAFHIKHVVDSIDAFRIDFMGSPQRQPGGSGRAARLVKPEVDVKALAKLTEFMRKPKR